MTLVSKRHENIYGLIIIMSSWMDELMIVVVKFVGALRNASGVGQLTIDCVEGLVLKDLINEVIGKMPSLELGLLDKQLEEPKPNALVLVNGREISVLRGLETALKDGDEIVFIPVVHGG